MSWALHYAVKLERPLTPHELVALARIDERHGFRLQSSRRGPGRMRAWKGLVPDEELARLEKIELDAQIRRGEQWDYEDFISIHNDHQLGRIVVWLREVEGLIPARDFTVREDYSITEACRPSEVDLVGILEKATRTPIDEDEEDVEVDQLLSEASAARARSVSAGLEQARRDFEFWKKSQKKD